MFRGPIKAQEWIRKAGRKDSVGDIRLTNTNPLKGLRKTQNIAEYLLVPIPNVWLPILVWKAIKLRSQKKDEDILSYLDRFEKDFIKNSGIKTLERNTIKLFATLFLDELLNLISTLVKQYDPDWDTKSPAILGSNGNRLAKARGREKESCAKHALACQ